jgi:hypothetical protein
MPCNAYGLESWRSRNERLGVERAKTDNWLLLSIWATTIALPVMAMGFRLSWDPPLARVTLKNAQREMAVTVVDRATGRL